MTKQIKVFICVIICLLVICKVQADAEKALRISNLINLLTTSYNNGFFIPENKLQPSGFNIQMHNLTKKDVAIVNIFRLTRFELLDDVKIKEVIPINEYAILNKMRHPQCPDVLFFEVEIECGKKAIFVPITPWGSPIDISYDIICFYVANIKILNKNIPLFFVLQVIPTSQPKKYEFFKNYCTNFAKNAHPFPDYPDVIPQDTVGLDEDTIKLYLKHLTYFEALTNGFDFHLMQEAEQWRTGVIE